ncbi:MAG: ABC transporter substrate-binding protein, partial [Gammaproteobacteria bacterium]
MPYSRTFFIHTKAGWLAAVCWLAVCLLPASALALEHVSLQLKWLHAFQFAGYYAAKEKGFYAEEGLDVDIRERIPGINNIRQVIEGEAEYGVADTGLLQERLNGQPVVVLASIFQHNPLVFLTLKKSGIVSPYELVGKRVMSDLNEDAPLIAMLHEAGLSSSNFTQVDNSFDLNDLINGKVDAISAYLTDQVDVLNTKGIPINIIDPRNYGVDFLGDNLFTTEQELAQHPGRAQRFLHASLKGWTYALQHPEELIQIILARYNPSNRLSKDHLRFEAGETAKMILPDLIPLGTTDFKRFQRIADTYLEMGLANSMANWEGFIYNQKNTQALNLSQAEKDWLARHPIVRVGIDPDFAPHEWVTKNGQYAGLTADYLKLIEQRLGIKFEIIVNKSRPEILEMAKHGELDMLADVNRTPNRDHYLYFTGPYISHPIIIIDQGNTGFAGNLKRLKGKRVTVEEGYFMQEILARDYPGIQLVPSKNIRDALNKVRRGEADAYVGDAATSSYTVKQEGFLELRFSGETEYRSEHRMAAAKTSPELVSLLAKALNDIPLPEKESIENRWLNIQPKSGVAFETLFKYAAALLLLFILIISWNTRLHREIRKRKKIEHEFRKTENSLRMAASVFANTQEGILLTDKHGNIIDINHAFSKITGYTRNEVLGKNLRLFKSGLQNKDAYATMWHCINTQGYWSGEL